LPHQVVILGEEGNTLHSIVIKNGTLVDGTGAKAVPMDLAMDGTKVGGLYKPSEAKGSVTIDASGMVVCPGFIDIHTHSDLHLLSNPQAHSKIHQGVTTELVGNCGGSAAPLLGSARTAIEDEANELLVDIDWTSMDEYLLRLHNLKTSVNVASLVGAETIRRCVLGNGDVDPSADELDQMRILVADAMLQGAFGLSSGLIYAPGCYASTEELIALAATAASFGGLYSSHIRGEGTTLVKAVEEAIRIGREAGVRVEISHHKACGSANWGKVRQTIGMIEKARSEGVDVAFDVYPYTASSAALDSILPPWVREGSREEIISRLEDKDMRARISKELQTKSDSWEAMAAETDWDCIVVAGLRTEANRRFENKSVLHISKELGKKPVDTALDLIVEEKMQVYGIYHEINEDDVVSVISNPLSSIGSDGSSESPFGPLAEFATHPRAYGTFPRVLRNYVFDKTTLTLEEAIRKMTSWPADRIGLLDRGVLAAGMAADVVVFDPQKVRDRATFEDSHKFPEGIEYVFVNGAVTIEKGEHTNERAGLVIRHKPSVA
jgi:N-acyl-D-amino-acid deacylase